MDTIISNYSTAVPSIIAGSELFIAGRDPNGNFKDPVGLVKEERAFFPGEYLLLTENPAWILQNYPTGRPASQILSLPALPSMPDDQGKIVLLNASGDVIDELDYDHHWHSPLLTSESGVALERINPDLPTNLASNWTSAAAACRIWNTRLQKFRIIFRQVIPIRISFLLNRKYFHLIMDGYQDFLFIHYQLPAAGIYRKHFDL